MLDLHRRQEMDVYLQKAHDRTGIGLAGKISILHTHIAWVKIPDPLLISTSCKGRAGDGSNGPWLLAPAWFHSGFCRHLQNELADGDPYICRLRLSAFSNKVIKKIFLIP